MIYQVFVSGLRFQYQNMQQEITCLLTKLRMDKSCFSPCTDREIGATRFDALAIFTFFKFMYPIWHLDLSSTSGVIVPISDIDLFHDLIEQDGETVINPIALTVLIVADGEVDKTVMNPSSGTWTKKRDVLPAWIKESVRRMESEENHIAAEMTKN